jgi:TPP-dependent pyruvate/acetoin dehydrogenase alpha subunit
VREETFKEQIATAVNEAIAAAESNGPPADETLITDVYADVPQQLKHQLVDVLAVRGERKNEGAFPL